MDYVEDIEDIEEIEDNQDSFAEVAYSGIMKVDWVLLLIIAISFLFIISDVFLNQILINIPDAVQHNEATTWGSLIQTASLLFTIVIANAIRSYW